MTETARAVRKEALPKISTAEAGADFAALAAKKILAAKNRRVLHLSEMLVLVPNRDIGRALQRALKDILGDRAAALPQIRTLADVDDAALEMKVSDNPALSAALADLPPPIARLERETFLADEIMKVSPVVKSFPKALKLARALGKFIDMAERYDVDVRAFSDMVPETYHAEWRQTEQFLKIITETWPEKLKELGKMNPVARQNALLQVQAADWRQRPPRHPVFAVGFDEDTPFLRTFFAALLSLPKGEMILSGLDLSLDQKTWEALAPTHPQFHLKKMLEGLSLDRTLVVPLAAESSKTAETEARRALLREALLPVATAHSLPAKTAAAAPKKGRKSPPVAKPAPTGLAAGFKGLDLLVAGTPQEEASVIALKMRESLEFKGRTVALVTADRSLARRVSARLRYWKIDVEDEAGLPLSLTPVGIYLLSIGEAGVERLAPAATLAMLKHPLAALGENKKGFSRKLAALEDFVLRGARPAPGIEGAKDALAAAFNRAAKRADDQKALEEKKEMLEALLQKLDNAGKNFFDRISSKAPSPFTEILSAHLAFAEALAANDKSGGAERLWRGEDGVAAARMLAGLLQEKDVFPPMTGAEYLEILQDLLSEKSVMLNRARHPTLRIITPEQARTAKADVMVLGGMNDEVFPEKTPENPWLSADMIARAGLPDARARLGRDAHIFTDILLNREVLITRALRSGNAPAVASSLLMRLTTLARALGLEAQFDGDTPLLEVHIAMHTPAAVTPAPPPAPTPAKDLRPTSLPVTAVEMLMRDPYSVYVRYVLRLRQKEKIDAAPNHSDRGIFTHAALDAFLKKYPAELPANAEEELLKIGKEVFSTRMQNPGVHAFWWPRFERIAKWFVTFEKERRVASQNLGSEVRGKLEIDIGGDVFTLTTIADRIDLGADGTVEVIDYKTGSVPAQKDVALGVSPQLTLEALISFSGGFKGIEAKDVGALQYWKLSGGRPAADIVTVKGDVKELMRAAQEGVKTLIAAFNDPATPYLPLPRPDLAPRYEQSRHLSRIDEWNRVKKKHRPKKPAPQKKKQARQK